MDEWGAAEFGELMAHAGPEVQWAELSNLARLTLQGVKAEDDPDLALVMWLNQEETLFRRLEQEILAERLAEGFHDGKGVTDVDELVRFALSLQNRRESRAGCALENHLEAVFHAHQIVFVRGATTEDNQRPDFLFPSLEAYKAAPDSGRVSLTILGARSTCKDRWKQVLAEASRKPRKHLLTLEPGISKAQTDQMADSGLQLVVPMSIQETYTDDQRAWLWSLGDFIRYVQARARR